MAIQVINPSPEDEEIDLRLLFVTALATATVTRSAEVAYEKFHALYRLTTEMKQETIRETKKGGKGNVRGR
jgi:hypothetical protein